MNTNDTEQTALDHRLRAQSNSYYAVGYTNGTVSATGRERPGLFCRLERNLACRRCSSMLASVGGGWDHSPIADRNHNNSLCVSCSPALMVSHCKFSFHSHSLEQLFRELIQTRYCFETRRTTRVHVNTFRHFSYSPISDWSATMRWCITMPTMRLGEQNNGV